MKLRHINPPLREGQQVQCSKCLRMVGSRILADLDAAPFTFVCWDCAPEAALEAEQAESAKAGIP